MTSGAGQEKILVIKLGALGDFVQAMGPMAAIRRHHPQAHITLMTTAPFVPFGQKCGYFDQVVTDIRPRWNRPSQWLALYRKLNAPRYNRVYDLQNNDRSRLYFRLLRPKPEWVGTARGASHRNASALRTAGHSFAGHQQTLGLAGIPDVGVDPLRWAVGDIGHLGLGNEPYILIVPGSAPSRPEKRWTASGFAITARTLHGWGYQPVLIGTNSDADMAGRIKAIFPDVTDLTGRTSLQDIVSLGAGAAFAIGNDTGPMHLIAPTGCPCLVLFSASSDPVRHRPLGANVRTLQVDRLEDLTAETVIGTIDARAFRKP